MSVAPIPETYWTPAEVEKAVARGFPRFLAVLRLPPNPSFDRHAPRPAIQESAPWQPPAAVTRVVAPARPVAPTPKKPAPRLPAAAPSQGSLI